MDKQVIYDYIEQNGGTAVPSLQRQFNLTYRQARDIIEELTRSNFLKYADGIWFESPLKKEAVHQSDKAREANCADSETDTKQLKDYIRDLRAKRIEDICRNWGVVTDPDVNDWLTKVIIVDRSITLKQALKQARSELARAEKNNAKDAVAIYTEVTRYLNECDEATFEKIKKNVTDS